MNRSAAMTQSRPWGGGDCSRSAVGGVCWASSPSLGSGTVGQLPTTFLEQCEHCVVFYQGAELFEL